MNEFPGIRKILVPVDFSEAVPALVHYALEIVRGRGARVRLLHVVAAPPAVVERVRGAVREPGPSTEVREAAVERLAEIVTGIKGIAADARVVVGSPAHEIVREATYWGADVVVVGTHGHTGFRRVLLGSVAEAVVRRAPCPVLVVRHRVVAAEPE